MRQLDLSLVLGSYWNQEDLHHLLDVEEDTDSDTSEVVPGHLDEGTLRAGSRVVEFIFYNPWTRERIDARAAAHLRKRANRRRKPDGHPTDFIYDPPLPSLALSYLSWNPRNARLILSDHFREVEDASLVHAGSPDGDGEEGSGVSGAGPGSGPAPDPDTVLRSVPALHRSHESRKGTLAAGNVGHSGPVETATSELLRQVGIGGGAAAEVLKANIIELLRQHLPAGTSRRSDAREGLTPMEAASPLRATVPTKAGDPVGEAATAPETGADVPMGEKPSTPDAADGSEQ